MRTADVLLSCLQAQISGGAADWFDQARGQRARHTVPQLLRAYTEASRYLGSAPLRLESTDAAATCPDLVGAPVAHWTFEDAGRLLLLLARYDAFFDVPEEWAAAVTQCYEQGDTRERQSWLRTLALLPDAPRFLSSAIDACRTSIMPLFEAIACENTYPAKHFPERNFNQLVLKALFNGVALDRIHGLQGRLNPELSRMARDYADERTAAGRPVPADISLAQADV